MSAKNKEIMSSHAKKSESKHINCDNNFKLAVVGDSGVGKSCFVNRYSKATFNQNYSTTIGVDYDVCHVNVGGSKVKLQVWDTAGQERFRAITMAFYRQSQGIFLIYDCCEISTLKNVKEVWLPDVRRYCNEDAKIVLVGNKVDNKDLAREKGIDTELIRAEAKAFAEQQGIQLVETSAKHNSHIDTAFLLIANELKKQAVSRPTTQTVHVDYTEPPRSVFGKICNFFSGTTGSRRRHRRRHARRQYR